MTSRRVALTAAFLALAAGGTAACDASTEEDPFADDGFVVGSDSGWSGPGSGGDPADDESGTDEEDPADEDPADDGGWTDEESWTDEDDSVDEEFDAVDEVFYCADGNGVVVEETYCAQPRRGGPYYLYHSTDYDADYAPGSRLPDGGLRFRADDRKARAAYDLPRRGAVGNGTVKTNVVGKGGVSGSGSGGG